jgi:3',5'-cyclic AMP phosphodiesterase CpdA
MPGGRTVRILHFSDPHFLGPLRASPLSEWAGKRAAALVAWGLLRRRRFVDAARKVELLLRWAQERDVDAVLCTGDYTAFGTEPEIREARQRMEPFVRAPFAFVTVPGNHDVYLPLAARDGRFERHFGDLLHTDRPDLSGDGPWPLVRLLGDHAAVVAVNSVRPNPPLWRSSGCVPAVQMDALARALADGDLRRRFLLVATHHAPRHASGRPDSMRHGLVNGAALEGLLGRHLSRGALVHGHIHDCFHLPRKVAGVPIFGAGSVTDAGREGFWLYEVDPASARAQRGRWTPDGYALEPRVWDM